MNKDIHYYIEDANGEMIPLEKITYTNLNTEVLPEDVKQSVTEFTEYFDGAHDFVMDLDEKDTQEFRNYLEKISDNTPKKLNDAFIDFQNSLAECGYACFAVFRKIGIKGDNR